MSARPSLPSLISAVANSAIPFGFCSLGTSSMRLRLIGLLFRNCVTASRGSLALYKPNRCSRTLFKASYGSYPAQLLPRQYCRSDSIACVTSRAPVFPSTRAPAPDSGISVFIENSQENAAAPDSDRASKPLSFPPGCFPLKTGSRTSHTYTQPFPQSPHARPRWTATNARDRRLDPE